MQYLKEMPNGNRIPVDLNTYLVDKRHPKFHQIIAAGELIIYKLALPNPYREVKVKYGGRGRGGPGTVWNGA